MLLACIVCCGSGFAFDALPCCNTLPGAVSELSREAFAVLCRQQRLVGGTSQNVSHERRTCCASRDAASLAAAPPRTASADCIADSAACLFFA